MRINHNIAALNTYNQLSKNSELTNKALGKLSSGLRINQAGDDPAGLSISEKMRAQIRGLNQATRNAQDGISLVQTAEGALNETSSILQRMRELSVQAGNDTATATDRATIQSEMNQLASEITRIADTTKFNGKELMSTDTAFSGVLQIGSDSGQTLSISMTSMDAITLGVASDAGGGNVVGLDVDSNAAASTALTAIDSAINTVSTQRSSLGSYQNRLEYTIKNLGTAAENMTAAESRIRDVDMASEMMEFTKMNILSQAAQSMLAQANAQPQNVLQLLR